MTVENMENTVKLPVLRLGESGPSQIEDIVVRELPLTIFFNGTELVTMLCSPAELKELAVGFLFSEGFIESKEDIKGIVIDDKRGLARVESAGSSKMADEGTFKRFIASGCGRGASFYSAADIDQKSKVESEATISAATVHELMKGFQQRSEVFRATGGVHSAALVRDGEIVAFAEDIGRHNAVDKVFGHCLLEGIATKDGAIITSGRISSEILLKVAKRSIPILISKSAPTNLGVKLADDLGVTLVGFVRGRRMNVYTHSRRIKTDGE